MTNVRHFKYQSDRRATGIGAAAQGGATTAQEQWHTITSLPLRALIEGAAVGVLPQKAGPLVYFVTDWKVSPTSGSIGT